MSTSFARVEKLEKTMFECLVLLDTHSGSSQTSDLEDLNARVDGWILNRPNVVMTDRAVSLIEDWTSGLCVNHFGVRFTAVSVDTAQKLSHDIMMTSTFTIFAILAQHQGPR